MRHPPIIPPTRKPYGKELSSTINNIKIETSTTMMKRDKEISSCRKLTPNKIQSFSLTHKIFLITAESNRKITQNPKSKGVEVEEDDFAFLRWKSTKMIS